MITRVLIVFAIATLALGGWALASPEASKPGGDPMKGMVRMMEMMGSMGGMMGPGMMAPGNGPFRSQ